MHLSLLDARTTTVLIPNYAMGSLHGSSSALLRESLFSKVALVTGAASGIGLAVSSLLASHGATVVMVDLDISSLRTAADNITGGRTYPYQCDISSWAQQRHLFACVLIKFFRIDIVCCNAGVDPELVCLNDVEAKAAATQVRYNWLADELGADDYDDQSDSLWKLGQNHPKPASFGLVKPPSTIWDVNVQGTIYGIKLAIHHMRRLHNSNEKPTTTRHIVVTGSAASYNGYPGQDLYCASKHALLGLLRASSQRQEISNAGIALSMVCPSLTETPMVSGIAASHTQNAVASSATDVAWAIAQLLCEPTSKVNGKVTMVRGTESVEVENGRQNLTRTLYEL